MSKRGLPAGVQMRHDFHYVEELDRTNVPIGKVIAIDKIEPNPEQPRVELGDLTELSSSIKEKGVLEPLLVKSIGNGRWMIVAGERRWRASNLAGLQEVPCIELDIDEKGVAEIALIENLQRKDLTIWEEADGLKALAEKFGYKQEKIAKKISKSRTTVTELMTIAGLPADVRIRCRETNISSKATLLEIARQFDDAAMHEFLDALTSGWAKPKSKQVKTAVSKTATSKENGSVSVEKGYVFSYTGENPAFKLNLAFPGKDSAGRGEILRALKQAFDVVKNDMKKIHFVETILTLLFCSAFLAFNSNTFAQGQISAESYFLRAKTIEKEADRYLMDPDKWRVKLREAVKELDSAVGLEPNNRKFLIERSGLLNSVDERDLALNDINKAIDLKPDDAEAYASRALIFESAEENEKALADFNKAISLDPNNPRCHEMRGSFFELESRSAEALSDFSRALELDPKYLPALQHRSFLYYQTDDFLKAIDDFNRIITIDTKIPTAYLARAEAFEKLKQYQKAIADVTVAIRLLPKSAGPLLRRAEIYRLIRKIKLAAADEKAAKKLR